MRVRRIVDLSRLISADTQVYPGDPAPTLTPHATLGEDGYNLTVWPFFTFQYWWQTRRLALSECELVPLTSEPEPVALPVPEPSIA